MSRLLDIPVVQIDPEFQALIPCLTKDEKEVLEASILAEGCREPLVTWEGLLLDGHTRHEICTRNNKEFKVVSKTFENRDQAKIWIINNQLGRRNLTPKQSSYLRGEENLLTEKVQGRDPLGHFGPPGETNKSLADKHGVSERTIKRDAQFAAALDKLPPEERAAVLAGSSKKTRKEILAAANKVNGATENTNEAPKVESTTPEEPIQKPDSEALYQLKSAWRLANKTDRGRFLRWIKNQE